VGSGSTAELIRFSLFQIVVCVLALPVRPRTVFDFLNCVILGLHGCVARSCVKVEVPRAGIEGKRG